MLDPAAGLALAACSGLALPLNEPRWRFPSLSLLKPAPPRSATGPTAEAREANAKLLVGVLSDYGVQGTIDKNNPGPGGHAVRTGAGRRHPQRARDRPGRRRGAQPVGDRGAHRHRAGPQRDRHRGAERAARDRLPVGDCFASDAWRGYQGRLPLALGKDIGGGPVIADLSRMPHLLIAGTTGSGKSVGINAMILSLLYRMPPEHAG
jgi:S-DNA-T family DNA segregation ATPase FtsK/SpoIIIE